MFSLICDDYFLLVAAISRLVAQDALWLAHNCYCVRLLCDFVVKSWLLKELSTAHMVVLVLVFLKKFTQLLLSKTLQCISLRLQLFLQNLHLLILLLLQLHYLQTNLILAELLSFDLLLPLKLLNQQFGIVCLMVNFLICAFFFNSSQINDVLGNAHTNRNCLL